MNMPQPTDAHKLLEKLVGNWVGEEKVHPSPFDPQGGPAAGKVQNRKSIGGFAVVQDYVQERGGKVNFTGHGVFWFDANRGAYIITWWDSFGMPPSEFVGKNDNGVVTFLCKAPHGHSKAIYDLRENGRYGFRMEVSPDGIQWFPFLEGNYRRE